MPRVIQAAMAHLNLVMIHPFSDGNGRMSRCLQALEPNGEKRGRFYTASEMVLDIRRKNAEPKNVTDPFTEPEEATKKAAAAGVNLSQPGMEEPTS